MPGGGVLQSLQKEGSHAMANDTKHAANGAADAIGPVLAAPGKDAYGWLSRVIPGGALLTILNGSTS